MSNRKAAGHRLRSLPIASALAIFLSVGVALGAETVTASGRVYDHVAGGAIAGAKVTIIDRNGVVHDATTDVRGRYRIIGAAPGMLDISVRHDGYAPESEECEAGSNDSVDVQFGLVTHMTNIMQRHFRCVVEPDVYDRYTIK